MRPIFHVPFVVWFSMAVYGVVVGGLCFFQYTHFLYSGYDLGIYNQVLWNTVHGRWFAYSFAPYSYLVDHREWLLLLIAPVYAVVQHPWTLLVIQTAVIASAAIPVYFLARHILPHYYDGERVGVLAAVFYLLNPSVAAMNLYEFHILPFAMPLIFWFWYAVERRRLWPAVCCAAALLLVREDVALMMIGAGILFLCTQRTRIPHAVWWGAGLILVSAVWFFFMVQLGARLSPDHASKFFVYYQWLGNTPVDALHTFFSQPFRALGIFFGRDHIALLLFLAAGVGFLCLAAPVYLLPTLGTLALYLFIDTSMLSSLNTHYAAVLVPWAIIAAMVGLRNLLPALDRLGRRLPSIGAHAVVIPVALAIILAQTTLTAASGNIVHSLRRARSIDQQTYRDVVAMIPVEDAVMASDRLYYPLSKRERLYPALHLFTGVEHYSHTPYTPPEQIDWLLLENESLLRFGKHLGFGDTTDAWKRLQQLIDTQHLVLVSATEDLFVYHRTASASVLPPLITHDGRTLAHPLQLDVNGDVLLTGWEHEPSAGMLALSFQKLAPATTTDDEQIELDWTDATGKSIKKKISALGAGIYPTHAWNAGEQLTLRIPSTVPEGATQVQLRIAPLTVRTDSFFVLGSVEQILDDARAAAVTLSEF